MDGDVCIINLTQTDAKTVSFLREDLQKKNANDDGDDEDAKKNGCVKSHSFFLFV